VPYSSVLSPSQSEWDGLGVHDGPRGGHGGPHGAPHGRRRTLATGFNLRRSSDSQRSGRHLSSGNTRLATSRHDTGRREQVTPGRRRDPFIFLKSKNNFAKQSARGLYTVKRERLVTHTLIKRSQIK